MPGDQLALDLSARAAVRTIDRAVRAIERYEPVASDELTLALLDVRLDIDAEDRSRAELREAARAEMVGERCCSSRHEPADTACRGFERGLNGRCVYCDHEASCHPGPGATCEIGSGETEVSIGIPGDYVSLKPMDLEPARRFPADGPGDGGPVDQVAAQDARRAGASFDPARIDRIREIERGLNERGAERDVAKGRSFVPRSMFSYHGGDDKHIPLTIDEAVEWGNSKRGEWQPPGAGDGCMRWGVCETGDDHAG